MRAVNDSSPSTSARYRAFAEIDASGQSASFEALALGVADDPEVIRRVDELPVPKRQVNLVFASARSVGAPVDSYQGFREFLITNWDSIRDVALQRSTQTNEAGRCAVLLPLLASLPQPLALIELGASAGLCLYPDRYSYRYGDTVLHPADGPSAVELRCELSGPVPVPDRLPTVAWRAGIDLNPLDLFNEADMTWLATLVWPEHHERRERLRSAIEIARLDPPRIHRGDAVEDLAALVAQAPAEATVVVFHSAVAAYFDRNSRERLVSIVGELPVRWISNEGQKVLPGVAARLDAPVQDPSLFLLALDGQPVGLAGGHGQSLHWLA